MKKNNCFFTILYGIIPALCFFIPLSYHSLQGHFHFSIIHSSLLPVRLSISVAHSPYLTINSTNSPVRLLNSLTHSSNSIVRIVNLPVYSSYSSIKLVQLPVEFCKCITEFVTLLTEFDRCFIEFAQLSLEVCKKICWIQSTAYSTQLLFNLSVELLYWIPQMYYRIRCIDQRTLQKSYRNQRNGCWIR